MPISFKKLKGQYFQESFHKSSLWTNHTKGDDIQKEMKRIAPMVPFIHEKENKKHFKNEHIGTVGFISNIYIYTHTHIVK